MMEMESLTTIHYSGKYNNKLTEITKAQREILVAFEVENAGLRKLVEAISGNAIH